MSRPAAGSAHQLKGLERRAHDHPGYSMPSTCSSSTTAAPGAHHPFPPMDPLGPRGRGGHMASSSPSARCSRKTAEYVACRAPHADAHPGCATAARIGPVPTDGPLPETQRSRGRCVMIERRVSTSARSISRPTPPSEPGPGGKPLYSGRVREVMSGAPSTTEVSVIASRRRRLDEGALRGSGATRPSGARRPCPPG